MNANNLLGHHSGTEHYYKTILPDFVYTDGVQELCSRFKAYWFLDMIVSYQRSPQFKDVEFQAWTLDVNKASERGIVICTDGNKNELAAQELEYCDFEHEKAEVWVCNNVIYLPSEE
jgi:hypothetical protein